MAAFGKIAEKSFPNAAFYFNPSILVKINRGSGTFF